MQQVIVTQPDVPAPPAIATNYPAEAIKLIDAQINGLKREISELRGELTNGITDARESAIENRMERAEEQLGELQRLQVRLLGGSEVEAPPPPPSDDGIPPSVQSIIESGMITAVFIILGLPLVRLLARRLEGRSRSAPPEDAGRFERLEQAVDAVAIEVERVSEGQRYTNKLLTEVRALPAPNPLEQWPPQRDKAEVPAAPARS